jgi:acetyl/propionyl-CoA carboxylase alpha subunit
LVTALRDFSILGVRTNIPFLLGVLEHPRFCAGEIDTAFLDEEGAAIAERIPTEAPAFVLAAVAAADQRAAQPGDSGSESRAAWDPWEQLRDWRD